VWELTDNEALSLIKQPCHYCGNQENNGIDRKDNTLGYTIDNSLPCCGRCNISKNDMSYDDFIKHIHQCSKYLKEKEII